MKGRKGRTKKEKRYKSGIYRNEDFPNNFNSTCICVFMYFHHFLFKIRRHFSHVHVADLINFIHEDTYKHKQKIKSYHKVSSLLKKPVARYFMISLVLTYMFTPVTDSKQRLIFRSTEKFHV